MGFSSPATPAQVTASIAAGSTVDLTPGASVGLSSGASVITDPTDLSHVLTDGSWLFQTALAFGTYYCGQFDNVQVAFQRTNGVSGYDVQFQWFATTTGGASAVGIVDVRIPGNGAFPFLDSIPIQAPYLRVVVTPSAPGIAESARLTMFLRKGASGSVGTTGGDGILLSGSALALAAGALAPRIFATSVTSGLADWHVHSATIKSWLAVLYAIDQAGTAVAISVLDTTAGNLGLSRQVILPSRLVAVDIVNAGAAAGDFFATVVVPVKR